MAVGFYINNKNCYGCKTCALACKGEKQLRDKVLLREVRKIEQSDPLTVSFLSMACNHCEEPLCMSNCPVGAITKLDNGTVVQDHELCIGCQACIKACPYGAPSYDEEEGKVYKCDLCVDRQAKGLLPACIVSCPGANLTTGTMDDLKKNYQADYASDDAVETKPNFVITADPKIKKNPGQYGLQKA